MMHRNQFLYGTILHCTYSFWGLRPWTPLGDFRPPDPLLSRYIPCQYILDVYITLLLLRDRTGVMID